MRRSLCLALLLIPTLSLAAVHRVPSQFVTIQAGIDACLEGDTVLVAAGTYSGVGNRDLEMGGANLVLLSEMGLESTVVDCEGEGRGFYFDAGLDSASLVDGFTVRRGRTMGNGGGLFCREASPTLRNIRIEHCRVFGYYWASGGGAYFQNSQSRLESVTFAADSVIVLAEEIEGGAAGGGLYASSSSLVMSDCRFESNDLCVVGHGGLNGHETRGAGLFLYDSEATITSSSFVGNKAGTSYAPGGSQGGGIYIALGSAQLAGLTLVGNQAELGAAIQCGSGTEVLLDSSIVSFNQVGEAVSTEVAVTCSTFWANGGSDDMHMGANGNFHADPLFCDLDGDDLRLDPASPCLPANNDCGVLIGARGPGCADTPVFLAGFTASPSPGSVDLSWRLGAEEPAAEFALQVEQDGTTWQVLWQQVGSDSYSAHDDNPSLASGGQVTYSLSGRLSGEDWQLLRTLTVELPPAGGARLLTPHPNPFNPATELTFVVPEPATVSLTIYDLVGHRVVRLINDEPYNGGRYAATWNGRGEAGRQMPSGVYFVRFVAGTKREEARLVLLK